jgi:hypothetical protein
LLISPYVLFFYRLFGQFSLQRSPVHSRTPDRGGNITVFSYSTFCIYPTPPWKI